MLYCLIKPNKIDSDNPAINRILPVHTFECNPFLLLLLLFLIDK